MEKGKTNITKTKEPPQATLFVSMQNPNEKRKSILSSIRNTLLIQEEYEKILKIRVQKKQILDEIKKSLQGLNSKYQEIKKAMPNVKNVISNTEKEFMELDRQVAIFGSQIDSNKEKMMQDKQMMRRLSGRKGEEEKISKKKEKKLPKDMTKLERIQHNLDLINNRLKGL